MMKWKQSVKSMRFIIWRTVMGVLLLFLVTIGILNLTFLRESKENFIYHQLKESADAKRFIDAQDPENSRSTYVNHFLLYKEGDDYLIRSDKFTAKTYLATGDEDIIQAIGNTVIGSIQKGKIEEEGRLRSGDTTYYYYVDDSLGADNWMVFLISATQEKGNGLIYLMALLISVAAGFIASGFVSKRIVKPIHELEIFADEVAQHHWSARTPESDTREILQLSDSLRRMKNSLQETEERERQFLQSGSHNLKTPVMVIKGYAQAIIDGVLDGPVDHAAQIIRTEAENLERRISQTLKFNTYGHAMESERKLEVIRLDRLMKSLVNRFSVVRPDLNWHTELMEMEIMASSDALRTAFENLFENQIRFAKSEITVTMTLDEDIRVYITNDGPLFTQEDPMCLFDRYTKDQEGCFGLGLAIVKQIIEGHGGRVEAGNLEEGVYFLVGFPLDMKADLSDSEE